MKRAIYFLPLLLVCILSFKTAVTEEAAVKRPILIGCFTNGGVYVTVEYSTGFDSITDVRAFNADYPNIEYTVTGYPYTDAWYSGGHVYVSGLTVLYSVPGGGSSYTYPPTQMLDNDCQ